MNSKRPLAIVGGAGYVGLMTAVGLAQLGEGVICVDFREKIQSLRDQLELDGRLELFEPGFDEALAAVLHQLSFTDDYERALHESELIFVAVGTPQADQIAKQESRARFERRDVRNFHGTDLTAVRDALDAAVDAGLCDRHVVVMKSTVPAGTSRLMAEHIERRRRTGDRGAHRRVPWVSCPEFLREGSALHNFQHPDRIVIGTEDDEAGERVARVFEVLDARIERMSTTSAEMVKLGANGLLATKITFANELANLCDLVGVDVTVAVRQIGGAKDVRRHFLRAGVGFGGSCFPKDVRALRELANDYGQSVALLDAVIRVNERQWRRAVEKLEDHLGELTSKRLGVLGLAFKPNTSDMREAVSLRILDQLVRLGARVRAFDPHVSPRGDQNDPDLFDHPSVDIVDTPDGCFDGAEAVILVTEWPELANQDWSTRAAQMSGRIVIDGRCALDPESVMRAGLVYDGVGRRVRGHHRCPAAMPDEEMSVFVREAADAWRAIKAAFGEELSSLCIKCGADPLGVASAVGLDHRIGHEHLTGTRPRDFGEAVRALGRRAAAVGYAFELLESLEPAMA